MVQLRSRPKIALLIAGGGAIDASRILRRGVRTPADIGPWLRELGELEMLADVQAQLVSPAGRALTTADWPKLVQAVAAVPKSIDGLVVLADEQSAAVVSVLLAAVIQSANRPVICLGATSSGIGGARSALINAVQAATVHDVAGVFYLIGGRLLQAATVRIDTHGAVTGHEIGKVDFGLRLAEPSPARAKTWSVRTKLNDRVAIWPASYLTMTALPDKTPHLAGVVIVSEPWRPLRPEDYRRCRQLVPTGAAVVVCGPVESGAWPNDVPRVDAPPMVAAVWLMVALGHGASWRTAWTQLSRETKA